jgi:hypothetical protein
MLTLHDYTKCMNTIISSLQFTGHIQYVKQIEMIQLKQIYKNPYKKHIRSNLDHIHYNDPEHSQK